MKLSHLASIPSMFCFILDEEIFSLFDSPFVFKIYFNIYNILNQIVHNFGTSAWKSVKYYGSTWDPGAGILSNFFKWGGTVVQQ